MHNPDELVHRVEHALWGDWQFDEVNFDYPSLPKYAMLGIGKVAFSLGYYDEEYKVIARFFSILLGAGIIFISYWITRKLGGGILASSFATFFLISNQEFSINARFAHNDFYLTFFLTLTLYFLFLYQEKKQKAWLYAAFFGVGLAASSKYNGGVFLLVPLIIFTINKGKNFLSKKLANLETLFIGFTLTFFGFALGTPKSLLWMAFYFKRMLPALSHHASYGKTSETVIGFEGQWAMLKNVLGIYIYVIFLGAFLYFLFKNIIQWREFEEKKPIWILLLAIFIFDLPIMVSYNYQPRFFIPLMPFFAVLAALFYDELHNFILQSKYKKYQLFLPLALSFLLLFSFLRVISVRLLLENDPRIAASEFLATLPKGTKLEYTMYPPNMPPEHFEEQYSYPIFFTKFEGQEVPEIGRGKPYKKFNGGETALLNRDTDYFVIDSFTYARCANKAIYETNPVECDFFERLLAGEAQYYLIGDFSYSLPKFLPQISLAFVNPKIQVFQRNE